MTAAFSGNLLNSFMLQTPRGPFGQDTPSIVTSGAMSFAPSMHGNFSQAQSMLDRPAFMEVSDEAARKIAELQAKLNRKLGPEYISQRPGPSGGPKLTYAEGWKIINLANEVFGFNGWSSSIVNLTTDYIDFLDETKRFNVGVTAVVRVTLRDGVFHEDVGYGMLENSKSKGAALDKCKKEAVTDAVKRTLRNFGNLLGNCLYDKQYTQEIVKIKVPPAKFNRDDLHRRPEFAEIPCKPQSAKNEIKSEPKLSMANSPKPSAIPPHMRSYSDNCNTLTRPPVQHTSESKPSSNSRSTMPVAVATMNLSNANRQEPTTSNPLAPPPPQSDEKHVSFSIPASQELYDMNSLDDEFLATVDLGDLGDPGIGGHIDFDEGSGGVTVDEEKSIEPQEVSESADALKQSPPHQPKPERERSAQQQQARLPLPPNQKSSSGLSRTQILEKYEREQRQRESSSATFSGVQNGRQNQPPKHPPRGQQQKPTSGLSRAAILEEYERQRKEEEANQREASAKSNPSTTSAPQASPPMGGFHYPVSNAGSNTAATSTSSRFTVQQQSTSRMGPPTGSGIGLKRTADLMTSGQPTPRRPVQGMGLAAAQQAAGSGRREPFGQLEIGEGGDVKRVRRT